MVPTQNHPNHIALVNNSSNNNNNNNHDYIDRELILNSLLRVELSEAIHHYMSHTHRSFPVHYIFDTSDMDSQQQQP